jgi:hypothetical protein
MAPWPTPVLKWTFPTVTHRGWRWVAFLVALALVGGIVLNPFILDPWQVVTGILGFCYVGLACFRGAQLLVRRHSCQAFGMASDRAGGMAMARAAAAVSAALSVSITIVLHQRRFWEPQLWADDWDYFQAARREGLSVRALFEPYNEHVCVVARALSFTLVHYLSDGHLSLAAAVTGAALYLLVVPLSWAFVWRETRNPAATLLAAGWFALAPAHAETWYWYSASQWCIGPAFLLVGLILCQSYTRTARLPALVAASASALAGAFNYSLGLLSGFVMSAYLFTSQLPTGARPRFAWLPAVVSGSCLVGLALSIGPTVWSRANYGGRPPAEAINWWRSLVYLGRLPADALIAPSLGLSRYVPVADGLHHFLGMGFLGVTAFFTRPSSRCHRLALVGLLLVVGAYGAATAFRSWVAYFDAVFWGRYHLWPQVGWCLLLAAGLADALARKGCCWHWLWPLGLTLGWVGFMGWLGTKSPFVWWASR